MLSRTTLLLMLSVSLLVSPAFSQLDTATMSGRVTDPTGAVIAGAQITVVDTETNFESLSTTNAEGVFRVPSLRPGPYKIQVKASGFKLHDREGLELRVGDNLSVDIVLEVGSLSETVSVTGEAPQLQTETSAEGMVAEGTYLEGLPLYQRNVKATFYLMPNVDVAGFGYSGNLQGYHIDGLQDSKIGYFQDGTYAVANNGGTIYTTDPIQSTVDEVKVLGATLPAEYGHSGGGAMTAVQKTGTNTLHGEASEYGRWSSLQQRKYFDLYKLGQQQPGQVAAASELFQEPNATLTGPVYLPKIYNGKNKTFFLFAVERLDEKQAKQSAYTVPDANMLAGNFSFTGQTPAGTTVNPLYDPLSTTQLANGTWTRTPIPGNIIQPTRIDPVATKFFSLTPWALPNVAGTYSNTGPSNNFQGTYLKKVFWENYTGRIDQQFTPSFKIFGNFTYNSRYQRSPNPQLSQPLFDSSLVLEHDYQNTGTFGATKIISATLIDEFHVGFYRFEPRIESPDTNKNLAGLLGIPNVAPTLLPGGLPLGVGGPNTNVFENFTVRDDLTWVKGDHSFKFGYDLLYLNQNNYNLGNPSGSFSFDGASGLTGNGSTTVPNTGGISLASFELGSVSGYNVSIPTASFLPRDNINSFYAQDDWRVTPKFTMNIGVRYANESPWHTKYGQWSGFNPTAADPLIPGDFGAIVQPGGPMNNRHNLNFEPRLGIAWHPTDKLVIRGGFALMHIDLGLAPSELQEYSIAATLSEPGGNPTPLFQVSKGPPNITYPQLLSNNTQPYQGCTSTTVSGISGPVETCSGRTATMINPNLKQPYVMTWSFNPQYQLRSNYLLQIDYQGSASVGLIETPNFNVLPETYDAGNNSLLATFVGNSQPFRPFPNYGTLGYMNNISHATYHSGTVHITKRYSLGLLFDSFFTYSKSLDGTGVGVTDVATNLYKGPSGYDRRLRYVGNFSYDIPIGKGRRGLLNNGGVLDKIVGGYTLVATYDIYTGNPITWGFTNSPYTYLPGFIGIGGRPLMLGTPELRPDWQDLGTNRFNEGFQNSTINSLSDFAYPGQYQFGNAGKNTFTTQRGIGFSFSARKEWNLSEHVKMQFRFDFQNPLKWYNWGSMNTTVDLKNLTNGVENTSNMFGKVSSGNEGTTVADGGTPMMNLTLKLLF
jgi:hypothetical protein